MRGEALKGRQEEAKLLLFFSLSDVSLTVFLTLSLVVTTRVSDTDFVSLSVSCKISSAFSAE